MSSLQGAGFAEAAPMARSLTEYSLHRMCHAQARLKDFSRENGVWILFFVENTEDCKEFGTRPRAAVEMLPRSFLPTLRRAVARSGTQAFSRGAQPRVFRAFTGSPQTVSRQKTALAPALSPSSFGASLHRRMSTAPPTKNKVWNADKCLDDHVEVFTSLPAILGAYVGPNSLPPKLGESIMVAVNSVNACP